MVIHEPLISIPERGMSSFLELEFDLHYFFVKHLPLKYLSQIDLVHEIPVNEVF